MRRAVWGTLSLTVAFGVVALAAEKPPAEYQNAMKAIGGAQASLRGHVTSRNYEGVARDAATMKASFGTAERFWSARNVPDAVEHARAAAKAASDLEAAATARNDERIAAAQRAVMSTCMSCHAAHRERLPDGTFEIK
jgi:hypothetical protein